MTQEVREALLHRMAELDERIGTHQQIVRDLEGEKKGLTFALGVIPDEPLPGTEIVFRGEHRIGEADIAQPHRQPVQKIVTRILEHCLSPAGMTVENIVNAAKAGDHPAELNPKSVKAALMRMVEKGEAIEGDGERFRLGLSTQAERELQDHLYASQPLTDAAC